MQILVTPRLTLRPPAKPDAEDIAAWLSEWDVARSLSAVPHPYRLDDAERWIEDVRGRPKDLVFTIHRERLIGVVSVEKPEDESADGTPRLGYWLGSRWHGHGFMTEAARCLLEHAFQTHGLSAVRSSALLDNPASLAVQRKLGFVETGDGETWSRSRQAMVAQRNTMLTAEAFAAARAFSPHKNAA
jgi:RimJ/RimL family protein N-acetyltransferase